MDRDFHNELPSCQVRIVRHACPVVHSCITHIRTLTRFSPCSFQTITESLVHHRCTFYYPHAVLLYISLYKWKGCSNSIWLPQLPLVCVIKHSGVPLPALDSKQIKYLIDLAFQNISINVMEDYFANEIVQSCAWKRV